MSANPPSSTTFSARKSPLKTKILAFRHFIDGTAVIVINRGKIDIAACKKAKITAHDLAFKLRKEGVYYIQNVKRAVLEQNGELIVVLAGEENPKYPIITDGIIHKGVLEDVDTHSDAHCSSS